MPGTISKREEEIIHLKIDLYFLFCQVEEMPIGAIPKQVGLLLTSLGQRCQISNP